jgi:hypothetical protein
VVPAVVLGQDLAEIAGPVGDGAVAELAGARFRSMNNFAQPDLPQNTSTTLSADEEHEYLQKHLRRLVVSRPAALQAAGVGAPSPRAPTALAGRPTTMAVTTCSDLSEVVDQMTIQRTAGRRPFSR